MHPEGILGFASRGRRSTHCSLLSRLGQQLCRLGCAMDPLLRLRSVPLWSVALNHFVCAGRLGMRLRLSDSRGLVGEGPLAELAHGRSREVLRPRTTPPWSGQRHSLLHQDPWEWHAEPLRIRPPPGTGHGGWWQRLGDRPAKEGGRRGGKMRGSGVGIWIGEAMVGEGRAF